MHSTAAVPAPLQLGGPSSRGHRVGWAAACGVLVGMIAVVDYLTGYELNLSILYLAAVCLATWMLGRTGGILFSLAAVAAWLVSDILTDHAYAHPFYRYWETIIRIITWLGFALLLDKLKTALARADERFVTVLARLDAAVYVADSASGELLYMNERCGQAFGWNLAGAQEIERRWKTPSSPQPLPLPSAGGSQTEVQDTVTGLWYLLAARAIRWIDGRPVGLYIATDITDRKRTEELARQQQERLEMTSRLTTLGEMASTLAHEINQPLTAIANYASACLRLLRSGKAQLGEALETMQRVAAEAERAGEIVRKMRGFVRGEEGQMTLVEPAFLAAEVMRLAAAEARQSGVELRSEVEPGLPPVLADSIQIQQVLLNLVRNAVEAVDEGESPRREVDLRVRRAADGGVHFSVRDTGPGLAPGVLDKVFEPFFTTKPDGIGIGLPLSRSIADAHGGRIWASAESVGAAFHLVLPAAQELEHAST